MKKINIIIMFFVLLLFKLSPLSAQCNSVKDLIENQDLCNNKSVNYIVGIVKEGNINENFFVMYDPSDKNYELVVGNKDNMSYLLEPEDLVSVEGIYLKIEGEERNMVVTTNDRLFVLISGNELQGTSTSFLILKNNLVTTKKLNLVILILSPLLIIFAFYFGYNRYMIKKWKGKAFEGYIEKLFRKDIYKLIEDNSFRKLTRWTESYNNPDFIFRHIDKNKEFAIECKYISSINKGITWAYEDKIKNYNDFSKKRNIPVYIIIGIGGRPNNPRELFLVPLSSLKYPYVKVDYLNKFKINQKEIINLNLGNVK